MSGIDWGLELVLAVLLALVLLHAIRLERAINALRRDRSALGEAVAGFDSSAREAQAGLGQLRHLTSAAATDIAQRLAAATALRDDLSYLTERGSQVADRLEGMVRAGRAVAGVRPVAPPETPASTLRDGGSRTDLALASAQQGARGTKAARP